jgi:hypothetical protein
MNTPVTPPPLPLSPPLDGVGSHIQALLREPQRLWESIRSGPPGRILPAIALLVIAGSLLYGLVVGSFSGGVQWWAAPLKICGGLLVTAAICLPSLYVFACLCGVASRISDIVAVLGGMLALEMVLLASFGPVAWVFSQSTSSPAVMGFIHLLFWGVATAFGARLLNRALLSFGALNTGAFSVWSVLFVIVSLQMMTSLRPIIGTADRLLPTEKRFFLEHWSEVMSEKR